MLKLAKMGTGGVHSPSTRVKAQKRGREPWTDEELATLRQGYRNNVSLKALAASMGRSYTAVLTKLKDLKQ